MKPLSSEDRATLTAAKEVRHRLNRERKAARPKLERTEGQRQPRQRDNGYLAALRRLPCCIGWGCQGRTDPAHLRYSNPSVGRINPGLQQKPDDRWANPLCRAHHESQHAAGDERKWWSAWGVDPDQLSQRLYAAYQAGQDAMPIIEETRREISSRPFPKSRGQIHNGCE